MDLKLICIIGQSDLINPLILAISTLDDIFTHFGGFFSSFMVSWLLNVIETRLFGLNRQCQHYKLH